MKIPVDKIFPNPEQPRKHFDDEYISGLAQSIKAKGLQTPILVEDNSDSTYTLVSGECRVRAHRLLEWTEIEATVRPPTNHEGKQRLVDAMIENVSRESMSSVDEGNGYKAMRAKGMSVREISIAVGRNETRIYNMLSITELDEPIQEIMAIGKLPHDKKAVDALLSIPDSETRIALADKLGNKGATIKMVKKACFEYQKIKREIKEKKRMQKPALELSGLEEKPTEWDALYQINKVPPWQKFTESVMKTCDSCSLRPVASEATCKDCPLVIFCQNILEKTK